MDSCMGKVQGIKLKKQDKTKERGTQKNPERFLLEDTEWVCVLENASQPLMGTMGLFLSPVHSEEFKISMKPNVWEDMKVGSGSM